MDLKYRPSSAVRDQIKRAAPEIYKCFQRRDTRGAVAVATKAGVPKEVISKILTSPKEMKLFFGKAGIRDSRLGSWDEDWECW